MEFGFEDGHVTSNPAACKASPITDFSVVSSHHKNRNKMRGYVNKNGFGITGVTFTVDDVLGSDVKNGLDNTCGVSSGSTTLVDVIGADPTYHYFDIMAYIKPTTCGSTN